MGWMGNVEVAGQMESESQERDGYIQVNWTASALSQTAHPKAIGASARGKCERAKEGGVRCCSGTFSSVVRAVCRRRDPA